jgi:hypothetical protein
MVRQYLSQQFRDACNASKSEDFNIITLWGPKGVGKTTLATHYAKSVETKGEFVFWINAESAETVTTGYLELLNAVVSYYAEKHFARKLSNPRDARARVEKDLGLPDIEAMLKAKSLKQLESVQIQSAVKGAKDWLLRENNKWLIVFDNVLPDYNLLEFMPFSRHGRVILVSQDHNYWPWGVAMEVPQWTEDEGVQLLQLLLESEHSGSGSAEGEFMASSGLSSVIWMLIVFCRSTQLAYPRYCPTTGLQPLSNSMCCSTH